LSNAFALAIDSHYLFFRTVTDWKSARISVAGDILSLKSVTAPWNEFWKHDEGDETLEPICLTQYVKSDLGKNLKEKVKRLI
jgi:hypothetical protein